MTTVKIVEFQQSDEKRSGDLHGVEVDRRVREYMQSSGEKSYTAALAHVTKQQPELAREYAGVDRDAHRSDTHESKYRGRIESRPDADQKSLTRVPDQAQMQIDRGDAGAEIHKLVQEYMRTYQGLSYEQAFTAVLQLNPELAARYRQFAGDFSDKGFQGQ